jgi:Berberine and berberine like
MTSFAYQAVSEESLQLAVKSYAAFLSTVGDDYRGGAIFFEGFPFEKIVSVPSDATAYANRGKYFNCTLGFRWSGSHYDDWVKQLIKDFVQEAREIDRKFMLAHGQEPTVQNGYANFHLPAASVAQAFQENLPRLIEMKKKWDPNRRFNKWFCIPAS